MTIVKSFPIAIVALIVVALLAWPRTAHPAGTIKLCRLEHMTQRSLAIQDLYNHNLDMNGIRFALKGAMITHIQTKLSL